MEDLDPEIQDRFTRFVKRVAAVWFQDETDVEPQVMMQRVGDGPTSIRLSSLATEIEIKVFVHRPAVDVRVRPDYRVEHG